MKYTHRQAYTSRETTPRQRRLAAEKQAIKANFHLILSAIAGGILLGLLFICLSFL
jgi:hypothetical protein